MIVRAWAKLKYLQRPRVGMIVRMSSFLGLIFCLSHPPLLLSLQQSQQLWQSAFSLAWRSILCIVTVVVLLRLICLLIERDRAKHSSSLYLSYELCVRVCVCVRACDICVFCVCVCVCVSFVYICVRGTRVLQRRAR